MIGEILDTRPLNASEKSPFKMNPKRALFKFIFIFRKELKIR